MMRWGLIAVAAATLSACVATAPAPVAGPVLSAALSSQGDGFAGVTSSGQPFRIVSTSASSTELCRVVSIESAGTFAVESFCKAPGGQWR